MFVKRHKVVTSEALAAVGCVCQLKDLRNKNVFSLDLNTNSESIPTTEAGREFQTKDATHRKQQINDATQKLSRSHCGAHQR